MIFHEHAYTHVDPCSTPTSVRSLAATMVAARVEFSLTSASSPKPLPAPNRATVLPSTTMLTAPRQIIKNSFPISPCAKIVSP